MSKVILKKQKPEPEAPKTPAGKPGFKTEAKTVIPFKGGASKRPLNYAPRPAAKPAIKTRIVEVAPAPKKGVYRYFAICPGALEEVLRKEVEALPAKVTATYPGGVEFEGNLELAYLSNLKLRSATRVLLLLRDFKKIFKPEELSIAIRQMDWTEVFDASSTLAIYVTESHTKERRIPVNNQFWALKAKDAIVDQFRDKTGERPSIDRDDPDITLRLHLHDQRLKVYLDLSGPSLHERGYRGKTLEAPIKENLAASLLLLVGWDEVCHKKIAFYDPFCGSGTILIEAALIATRTAPGLFRTRFGFFSWKQHDPEIYEKTYNRLKAERIFDREKLPLILGSDIDRSAIQTAQENIKRAGMEDFITLNVGPFEATTPPQKKGLIVTNPPYGVRLNDFQSLVKVYEAMGSTFKHQYKGWTASVITSEKKLIHAIGLKPSKKWALYNGSLESQFSLFNLY
ncbi:MAG: hypothetical protein H7333_11255 [Bdellovibrionales bacterium]|nr:hypothetical protein [Oligoflexia bacterium]